MNTELPEQFYRRQNDLIGDAHPLLREAMNALEGGAYLARRCDELRAVNAELVAALDKLIEVVGHTIDYTVEQNLQNLEFDALDEARGEAIKTRKSALARAALARAKGVK